MKGKIAVLIVPLSFASLGFAQGFVNLDFESAKIIPDPTSPYYPYGITTLNAVPGWTVFVGTDQQSDITYNDPSLGSTAATLWATNGFQLSGKYSFLLQGGITETSASISQTGTIPALTQSILFEASAPPAADANSLVVSIGGQSLNYFVISNAANYTSYYGADVSAYAGQSVQLTFSALRGLSNNWNIDNIQFSSSPVPEPGELALVAFSALLFGCRRWRSL